MSVAGPVEAVIRGYLKEVWYAIEKLWVAKYSTHPVKPDMTTDISGEYGLSAETKS
jgi:hypothetical protein